MQSMIAPAELPGKYLALASKLVADVGDDRRRMT